MESKIIYTSCSGLPLCVHTGILIHWEGREIVLHNTPTLQNSLGGNVVAQPLNEFLNGRKILRIEPAKIQPYELEQYLKKQAPRSWNLVGFNCFDFVKLSPWQRKKIIPQNI